MIPSSFTLDFTPLPLLEAQLFQPPASGYVVPVLLLALVGLVLTRFVALELRARGQRVLILGAGPMAAKLLDEIDAAPARGYSVAGIVADEQPASDQPTAAYWLGPCDQLGAIVERVRPASIVLATLDRRDRLPMQALLNCRVRGIVVQDAVDFYERLTGKIAIEAVRPSVLIMGNGFRNHGTAETAARLVSMVAAAIGLLLVMPLLVALAIAIKLESRGPVLFVQQRAGRDGRPFGLIKFRTMHPCTNARSEWVVDNIERITRIGRWLRRFRLDEVPQLVNVLRGEMNFVGPRPHPVVNHAVFMDQIAYYGVRSSVRPGVTGWAQVRYGYANNLEEETEKMRYDLFYIKNRSLWLDARILIETVAICVFGKGASAVRRPSPSRSTLLPAPTRRRADEPIYVPVLANSATPQPSGTGRT